MANEKLIWTVFRDMIAQAEDGVVDYGELDELLNDEVIEELERRGLVSFIGPGKYMVPTRIGDDVRFSPEVVKKGHHLIADGLVEKIGADEWKVKDYDVVSDGKQYGKCSCPHGELGTPVGVSTCKHVFAVCMTVRDSEQKNGGA